MGKNRYWLMLDCCRSGNCVRCDDLPVGITRKVRWNEKPMEMEYLQAIRPYWKDFNPAIVPAE